VQPPKELKACTEMSKVKSDNQYKRIEQSNILKYNFRARNKSAGRVTRKATKNMSKSPTQNESKILVKLMLCS
jgi:hypothetical protein